MKSDPPHILCVNPWIHDFAAFDFWAKPLGLLSLAAILRENGLRVSFLDCLNRFHPRQALPARIEWDGRGPYSKTPIPLPRELQAALPGLTRNFSRYGIDPSWFRQDLENLPRPDLILVTSLMTYWATGVRETIEIIKQVYPGVPVVLGGIYASLCHEHAQDHSLADRVIQGPGEPCLKALVQEFTGVTLGKIPDPHNLDSYPFPALDLVGPLTYAPILTSRGCPFSCDYCASSFLEPHLRQRSPENVFREILYWHQTVGIKDFAFYDDALLVGGEARAFPLFERIIASGMALNFHTPNAVHIRGITLRAADLMFRAGFSHLRLGLETARFSEARLHDVKVRETEFFGAVKNLKAVGFETEQLGAYLLCGLPGQAVDDVEASMALVRKSGIVPVLAFYTPIPHTPLWESAVNSARFDITLHPVLTNNSLFPFVRSEADRRRISQLKNMMI